MKNISIFETYVYAKANGKDNYSYLEDWIVPLYRGKSDVVFVFDSTPVRNGFIECKKMTVFVPQDDKFNIHDFMKISHMSDYEYRLIVDGKTRAVGHGKHGYRNFDVQKIITFSCAEKDYQDRDEYSIEKWDTSKIVQLLKDYVGEHKAIKLFEEGLITLNECATLLNKDQQLYLIDVKGKLEIHHIENRTKTCEIV